MEETGGPGNKPMHVGQLIFHHSAKNIQWRKSSIFSKWHWENWISICKRKEYDPYFTPYTKSNQNGLKT